jgi:adenylate cyclase
MQRRLCAILAADVVGYSRLMGDDELRTLSALAELRSDLFEPVVEARGGEIIKRMGDGWLVAFPNAADAAACAIEVQEALSGHEIIQLRIGVHIGDVTFQEDDVYGDGINVAARLEASADAGQVVISDMVHNSLDAKSATQFKAGAAQQLKNITRKISVWHWPADGRSNTTSTELSDPAGPLQKPSIVVLPFDNFSSDSEHGFFADGIVEDLITALSRFPWLFVVSRNTSFSYKGENVQTKRLTEDIGVRYMVEGSLRMSPSRLRVTVQLIDAINDRHVWAENYDRPIDDLFDLQDEITQAITGVLVPALSVAERERYQSENHPSLDAWASYQKGLTHYYRPYSDDGHAESRRLFDQAITLDPSFADAHSMIAIMGVYSVRSSQTSYTTSRTEILAESLQMAERAVQLEDNNALAHLALGMSTQMHGRHSAAILEGETAIGLNPNLAIAHHELGFIRFFCGQLVESVGCF